MAPRYQPGSFVLHADFGPCAVLGVQSDALAGECLTLARMASPKGVIRIPLAKVARARLTPLNGADAQARAASWQEPSRSVWKSRSRGGQLGGEHRKSEKRMKESRGVDQANAEPLRSVSLAAF